MKKFLVPVAMALALTASGAAFAGSISQVNAFEHSLYGTPNPFDAVAPTPYQTQMQTAADSRIHNETQRASLVPAHRDRQDSVSSTSETDPEVKIFGRYGPE